MSSIATAIELKPIKSEMFTHAGYDPDTFVLTVQYHPSKSNPAGIISRYGNVSEETADDFFNAESIGRYFLKNVKGNADHPYLGRMDAGETLVQPKVISEPAAVEPQIPPAPTVAATSPEDDAPEDEDGLRLQALEIANLVKALSIADAQQYELAANELIRLRQMRKQAQDRIDRIKKPAYAAYKATLDLEREVMGPYNSAEQFLDGGMASYRAVERRERLRREEEENRRRREDAAAEAKRVAIEQNEAEARQAELHGQPQVAEEIRKQPLFVPPVRVQPAILQKEVPKVKGIVERAPVWRWRVKAGEEHLVPREYLILNEVAINAAVRTQKSLTSIPGIEVWDQEARVGVRA